MSHRGNALLSHIQSVYQVSVNKIRRLPVNVVFSIRPSETNMFSLSLRFKKFYDLADIYLFSDQSSDQTINGIENGLTRTAGRDLGLSASDYREVAEEIIHLAGRGGLSSLNNLHSSSTIIDGETQEADYFHEQEMKAIQLYGSTLRSIFARINCLDTFVIHIEQ